MEIRETYRILLAELSEKTNSSTDSQKFCEEVVNAFRPILAIDAMVMAVRFDENTFDVVSRFNRSYARLDEGRFLKINRTTPLADAIRLQKVQAWGTNQKLLREYPEALTWQVVPHAVVAVPIIEERRTVAGCVYALRDEFSTDAQSEISEVLEATSHLIYQVYLRQLEQPSH